MATMTKSTIVKYVSRPYNVNDQRTGDWSAIKTQLDAMITAEKTDGAFWTAVGNGQTTENLVVRHWVDAAAAQEWLTFLTSLSTLPDGPIESTHIVDHMTDPSQITPYL
jgi:hypothetical protein